MLTAYFPNLSKGQLERLDYRVKEWDVDFYRYVRTLEATGKPVILGGDLNLSHMDIDMYKWKRKQKKFVGWTIHERNSFKRFLKTGYVDTFRHFHPSLEHKYSFWSSLRKSRHHNRG